MRVDQKPIGRTPALEPRRPTPGCSTPCASCSPPPRGPRAALRRRPLFVQRRQGTLRDLRGRRLRLRGAHLPAQRVCALPHVPRRALQPARRSEIRYRGKNIAEVLALTVDDACEFFAEEPLVLRPLNVLREVGVGYLRLGPARDGALRRRSPTHQARDRTAAGPARRHPVCARRTHDRAASRRRAEVAGTARSAWCDQGNTVIVVEHDLSVIARSDWIIDDRPRRRATKAVASS